MKLTIYILFVLLLFFTILFFVGGCQPEMNPNTDVVDMTEPISNPFLEERPDGTIWADLRVLTLGLNRATSRLVGTENE